MYSTPDASTGLILRKVLNSASESQFFIKFMIQQKYPEFITIWNKLGSEFIILETIPHSSKKKKRWYFNVETLIFL